MLKLGIWAENLMGINEKSIPQVLECYYRATEHDKDWYKV
jgi:FKBP12-rapamycin complex-associated protein